MEGSLQQQLLLVFELGTKKEQALTDLLHRTVWDHGHGQTQMSCNFQTFSFSKLTTTTTNKQTKQKKMDFQNACLSVAFVELFCTKRAAPQYVSLATIPVSP